MFDALRITTLHPAVVHLPLGILPWIVVAYALAAAKRSERWMFVADASLIFLVVTALASGALGYLAFFTLSWPGGLGPWPIVHLILGTATTLGALVLGALRLRSVRSAARQGGMPRNLRPIATRWMLSSLALTVLGLSTGYIGGEVLVFHAGMAVKATGNGALAPPLERSDDAPGSLMETMHRLRPLWASSVTLTARAVVERPQAIDFATLADNARRMQKLARWLQDWGGRSGGGEHAEHHDRARIAQLAAAFGESAEQLEHSAKRTDLQGSIEALGGVSVACAHCHQDQRWREPRVEPAPGSQEGQALR